VLSTATAAVISGLIGLGIYMQVQRGLDNLHFDLRQHVFYPDIEAAEWLRSHSGTDAVVMARKEDLVYHYCGRKVIWFPPSSDPKLLMDGICKHHVKWIIVVERTDSYFLPADDDCFQSLERNYPDSFHLVHQGPHNRIFEVAPFDMELAKFTKSHRGGTSVGKRKRRTAGMAS